MKLTKSQSRGFHTSLKMETFTGNVREDIYIYIIYKYKAAPPKDTQT